MVISEGILKGVRASRRGPEASHLLFADECILFGEATRQGAIFLKDILKEYEQCSGQCVNFHKSVIFYSSNTTARDKEKISSLLSVRSSTNLEKYLGLSNVVGRRKKKAFQNLKDRIISRIDSWSTRLLSQWGKESIWAAKGILEKGVCWRVDADAEKILRIPLARTPHDDLLVWGGKYSGEFSISLSQRRLFCCRFWAIWGERNKKLHEKKNSTGQDIVNFINNYIEELNGIERKTLEKRNESRRWSYPPKEFIKINFDGTYDETFH
ncbi:hypothetical protein J1N35_013717 [Gossypium stocksii]|uniref:Reverse transcriptase n=1 Tax=Gossypium stocksii TaxID=47602 RepID=A0A9D3VVI2_9ROSI|nr:hypothetical protein J1N35_013717 [Gossypium stocksii]